MPGTAPWWMAIGLAFIAIPMAGATMKMRPNRKESSLKVRVGSFLMEDSSTMESRDRGEADGVVEAVLFLCFRQARLITGANLRIDGGSVTAMCVACC